MNKLYTKYVTHSLKNFHNFLVAVSAALCLIGYFAKRPDFFRHGTMVFFFCIISWLIHLNQSNLYKYMTVNRNVSHLPARQIKLINNIFLAFYIGVTTLLMYLFSRLPYDGVLKFLKAIGNILKRIISALFQNDTATSAPSRPDAVYRPDAGAFDLSKLGDTGPSFFGKLLDVIMLLLGIVFVTVTFVYILWKLYEKLSTFNYTNKEVEIREFILPEMKHEKISKEKRQKPKRLLTDMSPNGRIRKLYIRSVRKQLQKEQTPPPSFTPHEIEKFTGLEETKANELLHQYYEKARYSKDGCSQTDLEALKKQK